MKKLCIFFGLIFLARLSVSAQSGNLDWVRVLWEKNDSLQLEILTRFPFGTTFHCPQLFYVQRYNNIDTLKLKVYYDISGSWEATFCSAVDTLTENIPQRVTKINIVPYTINDINDTTLISPPDTTINLATINVKYVHYDNRLTLYPNPVLNNLTLRMPIVANKLFVKNVFGEIVRQLDPTKREFDLTGIEPGIYYLVIQNEDGLVMHKFAKR